MSGIFLEEDTLFAEGRFAQAIGSDLRGALNTLHHYNAKLLLILLDLHLGAISYYAYWKKENLLTPMFTGKKWIRKDESPFLKQKRNKA
ncbi:MAG: cytochrome b [Saprospiraceae bacterium]|jgi:cytochrome b